MARWFTSPYVNAFEIFKEAQRRVIQAPYWLDRIARVDIRGKTNVNIYQGFPQQGNNEDAYNNPANIRYQATTAGLLTHPEERDFAPWLVELARFTVPVRFAGVVHSFEQVLIVPGLQTSTAWTESSHWGNPFIRDDDINVRWLLRLDRIDRNDPWVNQLNPVRFPGNPWQDMPEVNDLWYPAGSPAAGNIHFLIPENTTLRVFAHVVATDEQISVACRLAGSVQSTMNTNSQTAFKEQW